MLLFTCLKAAGEATPRSKLSKATGKTPPSEERSSSDEEVEGHVAHVYLGVKKDKITGVHVGPNDTFQIMRRDCYAHELSDTISLNDLQAAIDGVLAPNTERLGRALYVIGSSAKGEAASTFGPSMYTRLLHHRPPPPQTAPAAVAAPLAPGQAAFSLFLVEAGATYIEPDDLRSAPDDELFEVGLTKVELRRLRDGLSQGQSQSRHVPWTCLSISLAEPRELKADGTNRECPCSCFYLAAGVCSRPYTWP